jgi:hypothetical protein
MVIKPTRLGRVWVLHPMDMGVEPFFPSQVCPNLTWLFSAYFYKSNGYRTPDSYGCDFSPDSILSRFGFFVQLIQTQPG